MMATLDELAELRAAREVESEAWRRFREYPSMERYDVHVQARARLVALSQRVR